MSFVVDNKKDGDSAADGKFFASVRYNGIY